MSYLCSATLVFVLLLGAVDCGSSDAPQPTGNAGGAGGAAGAAGGTAGPCSGTVPPLGTAVGSCTTSGMMCREYSGTEAKAEDAEKACPATFSTSPCDKTGVVGKCQFLCDAKNQYVAYYYKDGIVSQADCEKDGKGKWLP